MISTPSPILMDAEIAIEGHRTHAEEVKLTTALAGIPGVEEPILYGGLLVLRCDPTTSPRDKIRKAVEEAGLTVSWMKMTPLASEGDTLYGFPD